MVMSNIYSWDLFTRDGIDKIISNHCSIKLLGNCDIPVCMMNYDWMNEWMNECLTTPQHEKQIGYWVSEKGKCMKWLYH